MGDGLMGRFIGRAAAAIADHAEELTALDQAIGDGDHGINMKRGFDAVADAEAEIAVLPLGAAWQKLGMTLVMSVGGASGPLYGSLFMGLGKAMGDDPATIETLVTACSEGVEAVKKRGKSDAGEKTMLDVLVPALAELRASTGAGEPFEAIAARVAAAAEGGLESTRDMQATKGRASFLGERSVGHLDPGARSSVLLIQAACAALAEGESDG